MKYAIRFLVFEIIVMFIHWIIIIIIPIRICIVIVIQQRHIMNKQQRQLDNQHIHHVHYLIIRFVDRKNGKQRKIIFERKSSHGKFWH